MHRARSWPDLTRRIWRIGDCEVVVGIECDDKERRVSQGSEEIHNQDLTHAPDAAKPRCRWPGKLHPTTGTAPSIFQSRVNDCPAQSQ